MSIDVVKDENTAEAPEGGWGYLVVLCLSFGLLSTLSYVACLGIIFSEFLEDLGHHTTALTMLPSCIVIVVSTTGLFAKYLFNRFSVRSVAIFGGILYCSGSMMIVFVRSLSELLLAYSVVQGIGFGLVMPAMYTTFVQYFVRRRVQMMALSGALQGVAAVGLPLFIQMLMREFGFRGCVAILAALNLNLLVGTIALHPVEWHQKKIVKRKRSDRIVQESESLLETPMLSLSKKTVWNMVVDFLDLTLFLDPVFTNICIGMSLVMFADVSFLTIQSTYLRSLLFSKGETAQIVSIGVAADLCSRIMLTVVSTPLKIRARPLFLVGVLGTIASLIVLLRVQSFTAVSAVTALLGFVRAWFSVPMNLVLADLLPAERYPSGNGLVAFVQGLCMFFLGPLVGWARDYTQSFVITFGLIMLALLACVISWCIEILTTHFGKEKTFRSSIENI